MELLTPDQLSLFVDQHEEWVRIYEEDADSESDEEEEKEMAKTGSQFDWSRCHLRHTLMVSTATESVFLLNPRRVDPVTGEWKAW